MFDVLILNGVVVDGTGARGYRADVGVVGERIEAIGDLAHAETRRVVNAAGLTVAPGFIDTQVRPLDRWRPSGVSDWGSCGAWCRSRMLPSRTRDMAIREASPLGHHSTLPSGGRVPWVCQENGPPEPPKPRLLDRVRHAIETRHYSRRTEKAYVHWTKRYIFFHGKRHAAEMGAAEVGTTDDLHPRSQPGPSGGAEPGRPNVPVMDLDRPDYYAPGTDQISREGAPYIIARGHGGVLQGSGRIGVHRLKRIHSR